MLKLNMNPENFRCDVCFEPITQKDVKVHLQNHQAQILSLLSRLPDNTSSRSLQVDNDPDHSRESPFRSQNTRSHTENQLPKARQIQKRSTTLYQCSKCEHKCKRPHDYTRHYTRHHDCNATCPQCNESYQKTNEFMSKKHACFQNPTAELLELCSTIMKDVEKETGVSFKFRRRRQPLRSEPGSAVSGTIVEGSTTQLGVVFSEPDIGEMMESFMYEPQMEGLLNGQFTIPHSSH